MPRKPKKRPDITLNADGVDMFREQVTKGLGLLLSDGVSSANAIKGAHMILEALRWFDSDFMESCLVSDHCKTAMPNQKDSNHTDSQA